MFRKMFVYNNLSWLAPNKAIETGMILSINQVAAVNSGLLSPEVPATNQGRLLFVALH